MLEPGASFPMPSFIPGWSPIGALPRVAGMATMPSRHDTFPRAFDSIVGQVDRFYLFLDGHETVPECARRDNVIVMRSADEKRLGPSGKFLGLTRENAPCVYLTVDDDIRYPPDYVNTMVEALARFRGGVIAAIHGAFFIEPYLSFTMDQDVCNFDVGLEVDVRVDYVGAGTAAFVSSVVPVDPRRWAEWDMDDLMLALDAERWGVPRVAVRRRPEYLIALARNQPDSLWRKTSTVDESRQTRRLIELIELEKRSPMGLPPRRTQPSSRRIREMRKLARSVAEVRRPDAPGSPSTQAMSKHSGAQFGRHGVAAEHAEQLAPHAVLVGAEIG